MLPSNVVRRTLFVGYLLGVTVVALEVAVRIWGYSAHHIYDPIYTAFDRTDEIPYVHKPGLANARARGLALIETDSLGLRSTATGTKYGPKQPNEYRIAIAGDSVTFGEGVPSTSDTFPQVLQETLNRRQTHLKVRVFNFGASAYSVKQMAATLRYRMFDIDPDLVVMAITFVDFDLARTPGVDRTGYLVDPILARLNYPSSGARGVLRRLHLSYVLRDILYSRLSVPGVNVPLARNVLPASYFHVQQFHRTARARGVSPLLVLLPSMSSGFDDVLLGELNRDSIEYVDLSSVRSEFTVQQFAASKFDIHPSPAVHRRIGSALADYVLDKRLTTPRQESSE